MKGFFAFLMALLVSSYCLAGTCGFADTALNATLVAPEYPGGLSAFDRYIERNLQYPGAARMMCVSGKVYVSFVIDGNGKVTDVSAINCFGCGLRIRSSAGGTKVKIVEACFAGRETGKHKLYCPDRLQYGNPSCFYRQYGSIRLRFCFQDKRQTLHNRRG